MSLQEPVTGIAEEHNKSIVFHYLFPLISLREDAATISFFSMEDRQRTVIQDYEEKKRV
jgi:hypothetical protein